MIIDFCWEDDTTGCICGNQCEPPQWMLDMWNPCTCTPVEGLPDVSFCDPACPQHGDAK